MSELFPELSGAPQSEQTDGHASAPAPLPERLRPSALNNVAGQAHLTGVGMPLRVMAEGGNVSSVILWGPPGCGKTTLARIVAENSGLHFQQISAIFSGVKDLKEIFEAARIRRQNGKQTLLFVDEIHRFMKSQQDAFLPVVEDGTIKLMGATTENPSFELNAALLSRCQVLVLKRLTDDALETLLQRAEAAEKRPLPLNEEARQLLKTMADGDGRYALAMAEQILAHTNEAAQPLNAQGLMGAVQRRAPLYDKNDDGHYNLISALHKAVRGSDPDAALYWFARMLAGGEDARFLARRITRMAVEDIGLADPQALPQCIAAWEAYQRLGSPEGELALAQAVVYLATAPKSVGVYKAFAQAQQTAKQFGSCMPPKHILNAPTKLMDAQGYGAGYVYCPNTPESFSGQNYFPQEVGRQQFYHPAPRGFERDIAKRLAYWAKLRESKAAE